MLEDLKMAAQFVAWALAVIFLLASLPFVLLQMYGNGQEEYPHSGFCPDCPEWVEPLESPAENGEEAEP